MKKTAIYHRERKTREEFFNFGYLASAVLPDNNASNQLNIYVVPCKWAVAVDANLYYNEQINNFTGTDNLPFNTSIAERILNAYQLWGKDCVNHLYGDFSFVIADLKNSTVFCARDPLGIRPLFYSFRKGVFIFGSELRYVLASFEHRPEIRSEYLLDTLVTVKTRNNIAPFEHINRLEPGHTLDISGNVPESIPYWEPQLFCTKGLSEKQLNKIFRESLINAVEIRCRGAFGLAAELSGGLDSSVVTALAATYAKANNIRFTAFSNISPSGNSTTTDDRNMQIETMVEQTNINCKYVSDLGLPIPDLINEALDIQGCFTQQLFAVYNRGIYQAASSDGASILLSGFGGDELVSSRNKISFREMIRENHWLTLLRKLCFSVLMPGFWQRLAFKGYVLFKQFSKFKATTGKKISKELLLKRFRTLPIKTEFADKYGLKEKFLQKFRQPGPTNVIQQHLSRLMKSHLAQRLEYCYASAAQFGIEYRYPLLDVKLVETYLSIPLWAKYHPVTNRYLFRQASNGMIPEKIRLRLDKYGIAIPQLYSVLKEDKENLLKYIRSFSDADTMKGIIDHSLFPLWYNRLIDSTGKEIHYTMPGAFYNYLMMMAYFKTQKN